MPIIKHTHNNEEIELSVSDVAEWNRLSDSLKHDTCERLAKRAALPAIDWKAEVAKASVRNANGQAAAEPAAQPALSPGGSFEKADRDLDAYLEKRAKDLGVPVEKVWTAVANEPTFEKLRVAHQEARALDYGNPAAADPHFAASDAALDKAEAMAQSYALEHTLTLVDARRYLRMQSAEYQGLYDLARVEGNLGRAATLNAGGMVVSDLTTTSDGR